MIKNWYLFEAKAGDARQGLLNSECVGSDKKIAVSVKGKRRKLFRFMVGFLAPVIFSVGANADIRDQYSVQGNALEVEEITGELVEDGFYYTNLGSAIARNGDRMIVTGNRDFSVHIFEKVNGEWTNDPATGRFQMWSDHSKLAVDYDYYKLMLFGYSVAIYGNYAAVGIPNLPDADPAQLLTGAVNIYEKDAVTGVWNQKQVLLGSSIPGVTADCRFGHAIAMGPVANTSGGTTPTLVVGAWKQTVSGRTLAGSVHIYQRTGSVANPWVSPGSGGIWSGGTTTGQLGKALAMSGNRVAVSEIGFSSKKGNVYVRSINPSGTWGTTETLPRPSVFVNGEEFGQVVDIDGDVVVVGHEAASTGVPSVVKKAYVFKREPGVLWVNKGEFGPMFKTEKEGKKTLAAGNEEGYGSSVSVAGNEVIVGTKAGYGYVLREINGVWKNSELIFHKGSQATINAVNIETTADGPEIMMGYSPLNKVMLFSKNNGLPNSTLAFSPEDATTAEKLGSSVSGDSFSFIAGAPGGSAVYISSRKDGNWSEPTKFSGVGPTTNFGVSVEVDGAADVAIVGADLADVGGTDSGGASIYRREMTTGFWRLDGRMDATGNFLKPPGLAANDRLGYSVAIEGNIAVLGAWGNDTGGNNRGCVFIYEYEGVNWVYRATLRSGLAGDNFGRSVAIYDGVIAVGAPGADTAAVNAGAVYIYTGEGATWTQQAKLVQAAGTISDALGNWPISMFGDYLVTGSLTDTNGTNSGSLFIFKKPAAGWVNGTEYKRIDGLVAGANFGITSGIDADRLIVGAPLEDGGRGAVYYYSWKDTGSTITTALIDSYTGGESGDQLGASLSLCGGVYMMGANQVDGSEVSNIGVVNVYSREAPPTVGLVQWLDATRLAAGGPAALKDILTPSGVVARRSVKGWYDASLSGNHLPESSGQAEASRPSYIESATGYDKVSFNGSQFLQSLSLLPGSSNRTIVMVLRNAGGTDAAVISEGDPGTPGGALEVTPAVGMRTDSNYTKTWNGNMGNHFHSLTIVQSSTNTTGLKAYLDGVPLEANGLDPAQVIDVAMTGYRIGASASGLNGFTGEIADLYVYNRVLTKTEMDEMSHYLNDKWLSLENGSTRTPAVDRLNASKLRTGVTVFSANDLMYGNVGSDPAETVYTLVSLPTGGCVLKKADASGTNWTAMNVNDTFTQQDINERRVSISHPGGGTENYVSFVYDVDSPAGAFEGRTLYVTVRTERPSRKTYIRTSDQHYYPKNEGTNPPRFDYMWDADIREIGRATEWIIAKNLEENPTQNPHRSTMMYQQNPDIRYVLYNKATYVHDAPDVEHAENNRLEIAMTPVANLKYPLTAELTDNVVYMEGTETDGILASTVAGNYSLPKATSQVNFVYFIRVHDEIMRVESVTVNEALNQVEIGVTRGFSGTTAVAHATTQTYYENLDDDPELEEVVVPAKVSRPYFTPGGAPGAGTEFIAYWITGNQGIFNYNIELVRDLIDTKVYHGVYWDNYTTDTGARWNYDDSHRVVLYTEHDYAKMQDERIGYVQNQIDAYIAALTVTNKPQFEINGQTRPDQVFNVVNNMHSYEHMRIYGETMSTPGSESEKVRPVDYIQYENWEREDRFLSFLESESDAITTLARTEIFGAELDDTRYYQELYCYGWYLLCKNPATNSLFGMYGRRPNSWEMEKLNRTITVHNQVYVNLGADVNYPSSNRPKYFADLVDQYKVMKDGEPVGLSRIMAREFENAVVLVNRSSKDVQNIPLDEVSGTYAGPYIDAVTGKGLVDMVNLKPYSAMILLKP